MRELGDAADDGAYDSRDLHESTQHCLDDELDKAIRDLCRLVVPHGTLIISVSIEIGPALCESV